jgi:hypothetical protein
MGYAVQSLHTEAMPPVFISTGSPREKEYAWMSLMTRSGFRKRMRISKSSAAFLDSSDDQFKFYYFHNALSQSI